MERFSFMLIEPPSRWGRSIDKMFQLIRETGYTGVELNISQELLNRITEIQAAAHDNDLQVVSLLTGLAYQEGLCLSSSDKSIRKMTVDRLKDNLKTAEILNSILVIGLLQGFRSDEPDPFIANQRIISNLKLIAAEAESSGVDIVIEPINHLQVGFNHTVKDVRKLLTAIGSNRFHPMIDTIHMNIEETSMYEPIYDCGATLRHVHFCESHGGLPGTGHLDFAGVLEALKLINYSYFVSVKIYRKVDLSDSVIKSMAYFTELVPE